MCKSVPIVIAKEAITSTNGVRWIISQIQWVRGLSQIGRNDSNQASACPLALQLLLNPITFQIFPAVNTSFTSTVDIFPKTNQEGKV